MHRTTLPLVPLSLPLSFFSSFFPFCHSCFILFRLFLVFKPFSTHSLNISLESKSFNNITKQQNKDCPPPMSAINGAWGAWGRWTRPTVTCGDGFYPSRTRACNNPAPSYGGRFCRGPVTSYRNVTTRPCRE